MPMANGRRPSYRDVMPDIEDDIDIEVKDEDIRGAIPTGPAGPAGSTLTKHHLPSVLRISRRESW